MKTNKDRLIECLAVQSTTYNTEAMQQYIEEQLGLIPGCTFLNDGGNIYAEKGSGIRPCIVAHTDTVHDIVEDLYPLQIGEVFTGLNRVTYEQTGIGGDDKVGIYIALELLNRFDNMKAVFFRDEESGCIGSADADMQFFSDCSFVIQADRKGNSDFVTKATGTWLCSREFVSKIANHVRAFGYSFCETGGLTDVVQLKENDLNVCCANLSCGYYRPHTDSEYVNYIDVFNCLDLICNIFDTFGADVHPHKHKKRKQWQHYYDRWNIHELYSTHSNNVKYCKDCSRECDRLIYGYCHECHDYYIKMYGIEL